MTEEASEQNQPDPFASSEDGPGSQEQHRPTGGGSDLSEAMDMSSLAVDVARQWVQDNQKMVMLGAFGVGVFVGVVLRD